MAFNGIGVVPASHSLQSVADEIGFTFILTDSSASLPVEPLTNLALCQLTSGDVLTYDKAAEFVRIIEAWQAGPVRQPSDDD